MMSERIWDPYLTQSDKDHLAHSKDRRVGFGQRPALLLVDLYRAVFGDKPEPLLESIKKWPSSCGMAGWKSLPHIQTLLAEARRAKIPVIHITIMKDANIVSWNDAAHRDYPHRDTVLKDPEAADRVRRSGDIVDEVKPIEGEVVLKKTAPSSFWGTPLIAHLNYNNIDTLIVAGEATSGCVRATCVDAASYRFRVQVVEECVFDRHEATHALNLFDLHQKYADVILLKTAVDHLQKM
jgi:maleamate amidohydrolase